MGYLIALIPPFLDSTINYLDKFLLSKYNVSTTFLTIYSGIFAFFTGLIVFLFTGLHIIDVKTAIIISISGFAGLFILLTYFKALTLDEASRVASLFQLVPVLVLFLSFLFFKETLLFKQYIGCGFIIIAGFLFSLRKPESGLIHINKAFWYMLLACFFSAVVYISFKLGVKTVGFWQAIPYEGLGNGIAALVILGYKDNFRQVKKESKSISKRLFLYLTLSEIVYRFSRYAQYFALFLISAGIVSVLEGFQPVFLLIEGIILSIWFPKFIKEVVTKKTVSIKLVATGGIVVGLYLIFI